MSQLKKSLLVRTSGKAKLEDFIFSQLNQSKGMITGDILKILIKKFNESPPKNSENIDKLRSFIYSLDTEDAADCLMYCLKILPDYKGLIKESVFQRVRSTTRSDLRCFYVEDFIDELIEKDQKFFKEITVELIHLIKDNFDFDWQTVLYKKLFPFLNNKQIGIVSRIVMLETRTGTPEKQYLSLLSTLENIPVSPLEKQEMAQKALRIAISSGDNHSHNHSHQQAKSISFEDKAKLIRILPNELKRQLQQVLMEDTKLTKDIVEKTVNLAILHYYSDSSSISYIEQQIEKEFPKMLELKHSNDEYGEMTARLIRYRPDLAMKVLEKIGDAYSVEVFCRRFIRWMPKNFSEREALKKIALGAIKEISPQLVFLSNICANLSMDDTVDFVKTILAESSRNEVDGLLPGELAEILSNLDKSTLDQLFHLAEKMNSRRERKVGNLLCFVPYFKGRKKEFISLGVEAIKGLSGSYFLDDEQERLVCLVIKHGL